MKKIYATLACLLGFYQYSEAQLSCGDVFMDSGLDTAAYDLNENDTTVICPTVNGQVVVVEFSSFATELDYDFLTIYNGNTTAGTNLGEFHGTQNPGIFYSTDPSGCLTFVFDSDGSITDEGWVANISCVAPITCPQVSNISLDIATSQSATISWTAGGNETQWMVEIDTAGFTPGNGTQYLATSNPFTIPSLNEETYYDVYVTAICSQTDSSFFKGPLNFRTEIGPFDCGDAFYDNGTLTGSYSNDSNDTIVICRNTANGTLSVVFTMFDTESGYDSLIIYDGPDMNAPIIGTFSGTTSPGTINASGACLTFNFVSDGSVSGDGWEASIVCVNAAELSEQIKEQVLTYPNPTQGKISVTNPTNEDLEMAIYDLQGKQVSANIFKIAANDKLSVDMNHLDSGMYILKFFNNKLSFANQISLIK